MDIRATEPKCDRCSKDLRPDEAEGPTSDGKKLCDRCWMKQDYPGVPPFDIVGELGL